MKIEQRWREIDTLFRQALDLPDAERIAFLATAAEGDLELHARVADLLEADSEATSFLEDSVEDYCDLPWQEVFDGPPPSDAPEDDESDGAGRAGERCGPYRLVRRVGRGGMADVYLAERVDGQFNQTVAIKLLRRGLDTDDIVRRFLAERQILSSLSHPHIARVFDGGATENGLPYLVMEFVEGTPITAWSDERRTDVRGRLGLFCDVGRAAHHAHRSLMYTKHGLGWALSELGRAAEAEPMLREVVEFAATGPPLIYQVARSTLGRSLAVQGRYREAEPLLVESYEWVAVNQPHPIFVPHMLDRIVALYEDSGRSSLATPYRDLRRELDAVETLESAADEDADEGLVGSGDRGSG